jgi:hypothetical protein
VITDQAFSVSPFSFTRVREESFGSVTKSLPSDLEQLDIVKLSTYCTVGRVSSFLEKSVYVSPVTAIPKPIATRERVSTSIFLKLTKKLGGTARTYCALYWFSRSNCLYLQQ